MASSLSLLSGWRRTGSRAPREQSFTRKTLFGRQTFHVSFIRHAHDCDVTGDVAIRIDDLEDLLNEWNATLSKAEQKQTHSMGAELGNLSEGRQRRWTLASEDDIPEVVSSVMALFESVGLPYLEKYSDLDIFLRNKEVAAPEYRLNVETLPASGSLTCGT